jgi:hypothetical protein
MHFHDQLAPALRTTESCGIAKRIREKGFQTLRRMFPENPTRHGAAGTKHICRFRALAYHLVVNCPGSQLHQFQRAVEEVVQQRIDGPRSAHSFIRTIVELAGERAMESGT